MRINVTKPSLPPFDEYCREVKDIWSNHLLTNNGPKHQEFAQKLAYFCNVDNLSLFVNGHLALEAAISAFNFPKGSEVITTPFTFISTTNAIVRNGLVPVFCDVEEKNLTIDASKIEALITDKTVAIVPVHVYGNICDVETIEKIAKRHHLKVIYDSAHAFGVKYKNIDISNYGDITMFSFHATKVFNTIEGGMLTYHDSSLKDYFEAYKNFGIKNEQSELVGFNAKMNEFQACMGICNLRHFDEYKKKRKHIFDIYKKRLCNVKGIKLLDTQKDVLLNYSYFPIIFDGYKNTRDQVFDLLMKNDVGARKYFYPLTNEMNCYKEKYRGETPIAKFYSERVLTLPLYDELSIKDAELICDIILK